MLPSEAEPTIVEQAEYTSLLFFQELFRVLGQQAEAFEGVAIIAAILLTFFVVVPGAILYMFYEQELPEADLAPANAPHTSPSIDS